MSENREETGAPPEIGQDLDFEEALKRDPFVKVFLESKWPYALWLIAIAEWLELFV